MGKQFSILLFIAFLAGCTPDQSDRPTERSMPGSDRDSHGCIGSAGYEWCERTQQCVRPWILADEKGFENTAEAFDKYCNQ